MTDKEWAANAKRIRCARQDPEYCELENTRRRCGYNLSKRFPRATARFERVFVANTFGATCAVCGRLRLAGDLTTVGGVRDLHQLDCAAMALRQCVQSECVDQVRLCDIFIPIQLRWLYFFTKWKGTKIFIYIYECTRIVDRPAGREDVNSAIALLNREIFQIVNLIKFEHRSAFRGQKLRSWERQHGISLKVFFFFTISFSSQRL